MSFPRRSARTVDTPSPRRRRWWGTSVALALVLAGCAAPPGGRGDGGRILGRHGRGRLVARICGRIGGLVVAGTVLGCGLLAGCGVVRRGLAVGRRGPRGPPGRPLP